jgi:hypothetical protein
MFWIFVWLARRRQTILSCTLCCELAISLCLFFKLRLEYWIIFLSRQPLEVDRVLKVFTEHLHGPSPLATFFVARAKKVQQNRASEAVGLLFAAFRPAALAALAFVNPDGQAAWSPSFFWLKRTARRIGICALPLSLNLQIFRR